MAGLTAAVRGLLEAIRQGWQHFRAALQRIAHQLHGTATQAWSRHAARFEDDHGYRRTLRAAIAALASTVLPHPAVAAAVAVWVAEPPRHTYDDPEDDPPGWGGPRLWDTFGRP